MTHELCQGLRSHSDLHRCIHFYLPVDGTPLTTASRCHTEQVSQDQVKFLGQGVDHTGVRPDPGKVSATVNFRTPTCVKNIHHLFGMANQLGKFPNLADVMKPLRDLLAKDTEWCWAEPEQDALKAIQREISQSPVLKP